MLSIDIAARTSSGGAWPDDLLELNDPGNVIMLSAEDDYEDGVIPRLVAAEYDAKRTTVFDGVGWEDTSDGDTGEGMFRLDEDIGVLESMIERIGGCKLVVIDPVSSFMGNTDSHKNAEVRRLLHPLTNLAARWDCAILVITHLNKGGGSALSRVQGSGAFVAAPRAAWPVTVDPEDEKRRLFLPSKLNYAPDHGAGLAYTIGTSYVEGFGNAAMILWCDGPVTMTANAALQERTEQDEIVAWLRVYLADGPKSSKDVLDVGVNGEGFSPTTIQRSKKAAGIRTFKAGMKGGWQWALGEGGHQPCDDNVRIGVLPSNITTTTAPPSKMALPAEDYHVTTDDRLRGNTRNPTQLTNELWTPQDGEPVEERTD